MTISLTQKEVAQLIAAQSLCENGVLDPKDIPADFRAVMRKAYHLRVQEEGGRVPEEVRVTALALGIIEAESAEEHEKGLERRAIMKREFEERQKMVTDLQNDLKTLVCIQQAIALTRLGMSPQLFPQELKDTIKQVYLQARDAGLLDDKMRSLGKLFGYETND